MKREREKVPEQYRIMGGKMADIIYEKYGESREGYKFLFNIHPSRRLDIEAICGAVIEEIERMGHAVEFNP